MCQSQFADHKGKKVLVEDFTGAKPGPEFTAGLKTAQTLIAAEPPQSVLAVFDVTGAMFNTDMLNAIKVFTQANTPYVKAAAVVGITGLLQMALTAVAKFSGREFVTFKTRAEALDWLAAR